MNIKDSWNNSSVSERKSLLNSISSEPDFDSNWWDNKSPDQLSKLEFDSLPGALQGQIAMCEYKQGQGFQTPRLVVIVCPP